MRLKLFSISEVQRDVLFFAHPAASKIRAKFANESMANSLWLNLHGLTMNLLHDHPGYKFQLLKANHILYI